MKHLLSALLLCSALWLRAQVAVSYFPFQSILAISSNTEKLIWADFKLETNAFFTNSNMELSPKCNIKRTEWVNYYIGAGAVFNPVYAVAELPLVNGLFIEAGVRVKPLKDYRSVQVVFEISPYVNAGRDGGNLRTRLGIAYNFERKKNK